MCAHDELFHANFHLQRRIACSRIKRLRTFCLAAKLTSQCQPVHARLCSKHTDRTVETLRKLKAPGTDDSLLRYTRYDKAPDPPGYPDCAGHASCILAFAEPELYAWLLKCRRSEHKRSEHKHRRWRSCGRANARTLASIAPSILSVPQSYQLT